jgi:predicted enzyme related to lactoylglutathione lyase
MTASTARTYPPGVTCWVDTEQPDVDAAAAFYGGLFGWTLTDVAPPDVPGRYLIATLDGRDVAGIGPARGADIGWHTYLAVADADVSAAAVGPLGGEVVEGPVNLGPAGRWVGVQDPQGARFRLWQAGRRLGAQVVNVPGAWNFSDLLTADRDGAVAFYRALFGWQVVDLATDGGAMIQVPGYGDHLAATCDPGIRERQRFAPPGFADVIGGIVVDPDAAPAWRVTFTVADRDASLAAAQRHGATALETGGTAWTRYARIRDPQGAELVLSQFAPPDGGH